MNTSTYTPLNSQQNTLWENMRFGNPALAGCAIFLIALVPIFLVASVLDTRTVLEVNVWTKPFKFAIALSIYALTLSWYASFLPQHWHNKRWFKTYVSVVIFTIVGEMVWLLYASSLGEVAHFNQSHPILAPVYFLMGVFAIVLTSMSLIIGVGVLRNAQGRLAPAMRYSLGYGLITTFILTLLTAGYMSTAPTQAHAVLPADASMNASFYETNTVPVLGWLRGAGDLRVAHFFATHALHGIPLGAWLLFKLAPGFVPTRQRAATGLALCLSAGYCLLVAALFWQALVGQAFI